MANNDSQESETLDLFAEPEGYYPSSPKPTSEEYTLSSGKTLTLHLVGHNPLWGHHLWNGGRSIAKYLEKEPALVRDKCVLELGAGAGLPGLVAGSLGAKRVVITDYPDPDLISNIWKNIDSCHFESTEDDVASKRVIAEGYCWGADVSSLLAHLGPETVGFDILILADLLFNHSEHAKLVSTIAKTLARRKESVALIFFTPYRPWLFEMDLAFFEFVKAAGLVVEKVLEEKHEKVMFEKDPGDEVLRRTVFGYMIKWPS